MKAHYLLTILFIFVSTFNLPSQTVGIFIDDRDGQEYQWVSIGGQTWMAENLNYYMEEGSWCYKNLIDCDTLGRLYNWNSANKSCPSGWHLPSDEEWKILEEYLGLSKKQLNKHGKRGDIGYKLIDRKNELWELSPLIKILDIPSSGFNALPSGYMRKDEHFHGLGNTAAFWTSTGSPIVSYYRSLKEESPTVNRDVISSAYGFSVRCIKDP